MTERGDDERALDRPAAQLLRHVVEWDGLDLDNLAADAKTAGQALDAYVRESIVKPSAYLVPGFPNAMTPTFGETLTALQLNGLIAYLLAVSGK